MHITKKMLLTVLVTYVFMASAALCTFADTVDIGCINANGGLKMRTESNANSEVLLIVPNGQQFRVIGYKDGWYEGIYCGKQGYLYNEFVNIVNRITPEVSSVDSSTVTGASVVEEAKKYLGYPYVAGGASPATGFDCSGLTSYVYGRLGYSIPRTSDEQAEAGVAVEKENLQPGDLLIFLNFGKTAIGHSAIYIGNGEMIHSPNSTSNVKIVPISMTYYADRYVTARRIVQ